MSATDQTHWQLLESGEATKQLLAIGALLFEIRNELRQQRGAVVPAQPAGRPVHSSGAGAAALGAAAGFLAADALTGPDIVALDTSAVEGFDLGGFF